MKKKSWILSALLAAGVAGFSPSFTSPAFAQRDRDRETQVKYNSVPADVRATLDRERDNHDIKRIDHVVRNGREFYRAVIDERGTDMAVRIDTNGRVLSREDVDDTGSVADRRSTARRDTRGGGEDRETQIKYNQLPREAQEAVDRERGRHELRGVYEVRRSNGNVFYRAVIDERGTDRVVRVTEGGKVLGDSDFNDRDRDRDARPASYGVRRDFDDGNRVDVDRLPGPVKSAIYSAAGAGKIGEVTQFRHRDGQHVYRAELIGGGGDRARYIRVNENGRVLATENATEEGKQRVRFADLPGAVKTAINREVPERSRGDIIQITRDGRTYYRVENDEGPTSTWVTIQESGRVTGEIERQDTDRRDRR